MSRLPRHVHPGAWWLWALGLAVVAGLSDNPLVLGLVLVVAGLVVTSRRGTSPWARAFRLYLLLGGAVVAIRVVLYVVVGLKTGGHVLLRLPSPTLPTWAAGITLGGPVSVEGLLGAALEGLRLGTMIACVGAANALANPKRLLRALPGALAEIGTAVVVAVTVAPQLADSVQRVRRARALRGQPARGLRGVRQVALPVLQDTLDRSLLLAASMDSRGYGRRTAAVGSSRPTAAALSLGGLLGAAVGVFGVLDTEAPPCSGCRCSSRAWPPPSSARGSAAAPSPGPRTARTRGDLPSGSPRPPGSWPRPAASPGPVSTRPPWRSRSSRSGSPACRGWPSSASSPRRCPPC